jgi:hypothetical protein
VASGNCLSEWQYATFNICESNMNNLPQINRIVAYVLLLACGMLVGIVIAVVYYKQFSHRDRSEARAVELNFVVDHLGHSPALALVITDVSTVEASLTELMNAKVVRLDSPCKIIGEIQIIMNDGVVRRFAICSSWRFARRDDVWVSVDLRDLLGKLQMAHRSALRVLPELEEKDKGANR